MAIPKERSPREPADPPTPGYDAFRALRLERWMADVAQANPHECRHAGDCGQRFLCDRPGDRAGGYPTVELLASGELLFHCENVVLLPTDAAYDGRRAGLTRREVA